MTSKILVELPTLVKFIVMMVGGSAKSSKAKASTIMTTKASKTTCVTCQSS